MAEQEERLTERLMVQLSPRDLRALQAIADDMERPLAWVARRVSGSTSPKSSKRRRRSRGDDIVKGMRRDARKRGKAGEQG